MESISKGETSIKEFLALMDESIKESNRCQFLKGLNNKTKLTIYKTFGGEVKFKRYLNESVLHRSYDHESGIEDPSLFLPIGIPYSNDETRSPPRKREFHHTHFPSQRASIQYHLLISH